MNVEDIKKEGHILIIKIPDSKTHTERRFTVIGDTGFPNLNLINFYNKYVALRPINTGHNRFFVAYRKGRCTKQPVGINTFSKIPSIIAKYLNLPQHHTYTGHSFRRSSATLLVDSGADILKLKQHGGWKSSTVAEGYVDSSLKTKMECASMILSNQEKNFNEPSTSNIHSNEVIQQNHSEDIQDFYKNSNQTTSNITNVINFENEKQSEKSLTGSKINIINASSCTFNIYINK